MGGGGVGGGGGVVGGGVINGGGENGGDGNVERAAAATDQAEWAAPAVDVGAR